MSSAHDSRHGIARSEPARQPPLPAPARESPGADLAEAQRAPGALSASEARYAYLVDHMKNAVAVYEAVDGGRDFLFREFNRAAERCEDVRREAVLGRSVREVFPGVETFGLFAVFQRVYRTSQPEHFPIALYQDERLEGWRDNYVYKLPTGEIVAVYSDETEPKRTEIALQESEGRLRAMFESAPDAMSIKDLQLRTTHANRALLELFGRTAEEVIGHADVAFSAPEATVEVRALDQRALSGETIEIERTLNVRGESRRFHILKAPVRKADGEVIGVYGIARDVTAERRAEDQLRYHASLLQNISDGVVSTDAEYRIRSWNQGAEKIFGWTEAEVLGRTVENVFQFEWPYGSTLRTLDTRFLHDGRWQGELALPQRDGTRIDVHVSAGLLCDAAGAPYGSVAVLQDVTELRRTVTALRQAQKMEAIGTLASGIAHDFNNILYALLGYAELVRDDLPAGSPARSGIEEVLQAGCRATELVRRLLTFARRGKQENRPTALAPLLEETVRLLRSTIPATVHLATHLSPCADVDGDRTMLQQVLVNLCTNACHSMREHGGKLEISLGEAELSPGDTRVGNDLGPGRYAEIQVRDTGCGMDAATLEHAFEPYFSTKGPGVGTGLGLAIVHGIVRSHHGAIRVASEVGRGTAFTVYLPLAGTPPQTGSEQPEGGFPQVISCPVPFAQHDRSEDEEEEQWRAS